MHLLNNKTYDEWKIFVGGWGMPDTSTLEIYKFQRRPLPTELQNKRANHMKELHSKGAPISWIARLYRMSRNHARRIILDLPNNI